MKIKNSETKEYKEMILLGILFSLGISLLVFIFTLSVTKAFSVMYGEFIGILGFISIIYSVYKFNINSGFQKKIIITYLIRFLFYLSFLVLGVYLNLHIIYMLLGFVCTNIAIKIYVVLTERGNFN